MATRILLGPQRPVLNLGEVIEDAGLPGGPVAVIAAGWQEAEVDIDDVAAAARRDVVNLALYRRADEVFAAAPELLAAYRARQDRLQELQRLYGLRLRQTIASARQMLRATGDKALVGPEQRHAIAQLRALDRHHRHRVEALHAEFDAVFDVERNELLAGHRREIADRLESLQTVIITGGNVAVLLNRLLLFDVGPLLEGKHVVAWSAGAMALAETVVLYHDNAPQGRRDAEVFGEGLGLVRRCVLLPDARRRLRNERSRLTLFSRRFAPDACMTLDSGAVLHIDGSRIVQASGVRRLTAGGRLRQVKPE